MVWTYALVAAAATSHGAVVLTNGNEHCMVQTDYYLLRVDARPWRETRTVAALPPLVVLLLADGALAAALGQAFLGLESGGVWYEISAGPATHLHTVRSGPYLVEMYVEGLIAADQDGRAWPGLIELGLYCQEDRVYAVMRIVAQDGRWVRSYDGRIIYEAPEGHRACPSTQVDRTRIVVALGAGAHARPQDGEGLVEWSSGALGYRFLSADGGPAEARPDRDALHNTFDGPDQLLRGGESLSYAVLLAPGTSPAVALRTLADAAAPLPPDAIHASKGKFDGYDALRGVYAFTAETSPTPTPSPGLRAGTEFAVTNDGRARRILVDQRDPWGGITAGIIRDGYGSPLPVVPQFGLNFPELHADGEPGWATMTYPLDLGPDEGTTIRGEHLYRAATDRDLIYLTSLENIGEPLLLQTTVHQCEAHTLTTAPYSGALVFGNELRVNDFRRHGSQMRVRSVSAVLPVFFGYLDADGLYRGLMPGAVHIRETGPFLADYIVEARTPDGAVSGTVHVWQAAHSDMTRIFTRVDLTAGENVPLNAYATAPLWFLRHHCFNPMAFRKAAFLAGDASTRVVALDFVPTVVLDGEPLGPQPFSCAYGADNPLDEGIPCSDITGNPGFVLLDWDVRLSQRLIRPGLYAFSTGANDPEHGDYARDIAVVPMERLSVIPAGSRISYSAVQMVFGDNASGPEVMERERAFWALAPLRVEAAMGTVVSHWPPEVRMGPAGVAELTLTGGTDWVPVRVSGLPRAGQIFAQDLDSGQFLGGGHPEEAWYNLWPSPDGTYGCTFLVRAPQGRKPLRLRVTVG